MSNERVTDLERVMFPVELQPVFLKRPGEDSESDSSIESSNKSSNGGVAYKKVGRYQAVVDVKRDNVLSVVTTGYRLITNHEAVELAKECFRTVFSQTTTDGLEVFNIILPGTRSFCHIDFTHKDGGFEPWEGDRWVPFLRVTNSYNRTKLLSFDLGFCRWICTNGIIFGKKNITFKYLHTHSKTSPKIEFKTGFDEIHALEAKFIEELHNLKRFYVPAEIMLALVCRVFDIHVSEQDLRKPKRFEKLLEFRAHIEELTSQYVNKLGPNGYAALNVITDFASRPTSYYISRASMINGLQMRSGQWIDEFLRLIQDKKFDFADYLGDCADTANRLRESA